MPAEAAASIQNVNDEKLVTPDNQIDIEAVNAGVETMLKKNVHAENTVFVDTSQSKNTSPKPLSLADMADAEWATDSHEVVPETHDAWKLVKK